MKKIDNDIDYEIYLSQQRERTDRKWGNPPERVERFIREFGEIYSEVENEIKDVIEICCLGIRTGAEYFEFRKYRPDAVVYGVDLDKRVEEVGDNCFCYDFNKLPIEWGDKFDLVFSNSLDHAFDVEETIKEWTRIIKRGGYLLIQFASVEVSFADRYSFTPEDIENLFMGYEVVKENFCHTDNYFCYLFKKK